MLFLVASTGMWRRLAPLAEEMPPIGKGHMLSEEQITYCLAQGIRVEVIRPLVNRYKREQVEFFNAVVAAFNARCQSYRYEGDTRENAKAQVEAHHAQIEADARDSYTKRFAAEEKEQEKEAAPASASAAPPSTAAAPSTPATTPGNRPTSPGQHTGVRQRRLPRLQRRRARLQRRTLVRRSLRRAFRRRASRVAPSQRLALRQPHRPLPQRRRAARRPHPAVTATKPGPTSRGQGQLARNNGATAAKAAPAMPATAPDTPAIDAERHDRCSECRCAQAGSRCFRRCAEHSSR